MCMLFLSQLQLHVNNVASSHGNTNAVIMTGARSPGCDGSYWFWWSEKKQPLLCLYYCYLLATSVSLSLC